MSQNIKQKFGQRSLKYLGYWTLSFLIYRTFLNTPLIPTISIVSILIIIINIITRIIHSQPPSSLPSSPPHFSSTPLFLLLLHTWINSLLNTFSRIFRYSGLTDLGLVIGVLYGLSKLAFYCDDSTFVFLAGGVLLLAPGVSRVLGGSLAQVEKVRNIKRMMSKESSEGRIR